MSPLVDIIADTIETTEGNIYVYCRHMCHQPRYGVERTFLARSPIEYTHAVTWLNDKYRWETKLLTSQFLCTKYAELRTKAGDLVISSRVLPKIS
jgi:hypothetical protein